MKKFVVIVFIAVQYCWAGNCFLIRMDWNESLPNQFTVVHLSGKHCLVLASEADMLKIGWHNRSYKLLETNPVEGYRSEYFAVYPNMEQCPVIDEAVFARYGTVLDIFDNQVIMKGDAEQLLSNTACTIDLCQISLKSKINPFRKSTAPKRGPVQVNPLIEQMLAKVTPDSCDRLLRDLCDIHNRYATDTYNIEEVVPYLEKKFMEYNCDTTLRLPVSGYDAPAVIGVKWGEDDPTLDSVCVIGAHPDNICPGGDSRHQGAYDNGCGCVGFLEAARVMKDYTFKYTVLYVGFNAEEKGLKGSYEFIEMLEDKGSKIVGGAVTYDMVGISPGSSSSISHTVCTQNPGGSEFADRIEDVGNAYGLFVRVSTTSDTDIPTDTKNFWKNGFVASIGRGGTGGKLHTEADSINSTYDPEWLAKALAPGIAVLADCAEPIGVTGTITEPVSLSANPIEILINPSGYLTITLSDTRPAAHHTVSVFALSGKLITTLVLEKGTGPYYIGVWDYSGSQVSKGLYLISGTIANKRFQKKVVVTG